MAANCQLMSSNTNAVRTPEIYLHKIVFYTAVFINGMYFIYWPQCNSIDVTLLYAKNDHIQHSLQ